MTVSTTLRKAGPFTGNGVTATFPFAFKVFATTDVVATTATAGVETTLVLGVDYSVALNADQDGNPGGSITTTTPLANGRVLVLTSAVPQTQNTLVTNNGGFFAAVFNAVFDRAVILIQQLTEVVSRSVTIPKTAVGVTSLQIQQVPNGVLTWAADGSQILAVPLSALALIPALPNFAGKSGWVLTNDGLATASWLDISPIYSRLSYLTAAIGQVPTLAQINATLAAQGAALQAAFPNQNFAICAAVVF